MSPHVRSVALTSALAVRTVEARQLELLIALAMATNVNLTLRAMAIGDVYQRLECGVEMGSDHVSRFFRRAGSAAGVGALPTLTIRSHGVTNLPGRRVVSSWLWR